MQIKLTSGSKMAAKTAKMLIFLPFVSSKQDISVTFLVKSNENLIESKIQCLRYDKAKY